MKCKHSATYGRITHLLHVQNLHYRRIYVLLHAVRMNTMNRRHCAGLIAPCRVQLLSLNQPCAAISGVRRVKRLQPAISFRLSAAIKHPSTICDRSGGHTSARRACAGTVSGNSAAWQAPGAMSSVRPIHAHEDPDSDSVSCRGWIRCANVCGQVRFTPTRIHVTR